MVFHFASQGHTLKVEIVHWLDVDFPFTDTDDIDDATLLDCIGVDARRLFCLLMTEASRFRELDMQFEEWLVLRALKPEEPISFESLRHFAYSAHATAGFNTPWLWTALTNTAPLLTNVDADRIRRTNVLPFQQLTSLSIEYWSADATLNFQQLQSCTNLESLYIRSADFRSDVLGFHVTLHKLRVLDVVAQSSLSDLNAFFECLTLPSLEALEILSCSRWNAYHDPNLPFSSFSSMLKRSACSLEILIIHDCVHVSNRAIADILRECPSLTYLQLCLTEGTSQEPGGQIVSQDPNLLSLLTIPSSCAPDQVLVPRLRKLYLEMDQSMLNTATATALANIVESRSAPNVSRDPTWDGKVSPLAHVRIRSRCTTKGSFACTRRCTCNPLFSPPLSDRLISLKEYGTRCDFEG
ncbi:hypothetical protein Moror_12850 [Moniliophthora roreri MCA 2997]|uniref:F-box domain-containing protein n=1 Tax=Moniliophthora roreri (strain MCA 2997) TaxID=1381753 RepID=V2XNN8_MONRO|nr:hypothetical protein Moror_12850 [Moniliophthora roreri MCA 2997]